MNQKTFEIIEKYMLSCMNDSAHDCQHIYRVLYYSMDICKNYEIDKDVLIAAALLHDVGREAQIKDSRVDHAEEGAKMASEFLTSIGWELEKIQHVSACISSHRFRNDKLPESMEAKILFDADKLDVTGAIGIARTIAYKGAVSHPMYSVTEKQEVMTGEGDKKPSFFHEYHFKLKKLYDRFYTAEGKEMAASREKTSREFYERMYKEVADTHVRGLQILEEMLEE